MDSITADCPSDTDCLLLLLHPLEDSEIPDLLFERTRSPQWRWTDEGGQDQVTAVEVGLDQRLVNLLSDESRLIQTIQKLDPLIKLNTSTNGAWTCSLDNQLQIKLSQSLAGHVREEWSLKVLKWICFVFPRDRVWEPR